jgi:hypothetical protein
MDTTGALRCGWLLAIFAGSGGVASAEPVDGSMRPYVLEAVNKLATERKEGTYDLHRFFSQDLTYGQDCCIEASTPKLRDPGPNPTMCVAAVTETIVEALNLYGTKTQDWSFAQKLPIASWRSGRVTSVRANLFQYKETGSKGTGYTLRLLGLGDTKTFDKLLPGDFVTFNRRGGPGHAVVFMGYLADGAVPRDAYSSDVTGFRYFSAQGKSRPDGGFSFRHAWFDGHCPEPRGRDDDCKVIKAFTRNADGSLKQNFTLLNTGELWLPTQWDTEGAQRRIAGAVTRGFMHDKHLTRAVAEDRTRIELQRELEPDFAKYDDGSE